MELKVKLSARNTLSGKVVELKMGQTTSHVKLDIGGGPYCDRLDHQRSRRRTQSKGGRSSMGGY